MNVVDHKYKNASSWNRFLIKYIVPKLETGQSRRTRCKKPIDGNNQNRTGDMICSRMLFHWAMLPWNDPPYREQYLMIKIDLIISWKIPQKWMSTSKAVKNLPAIIQIEWLETDKFRAWCGFAFQFAFKTLTIVCDDVLVIFSCTFLDCFSTFMLIK